MIESKGPRVALKRLFRIVNGATPPAEPAYWDGGIAWATPVDIGLHNGRVLQETQRTISSEALRTCAAEVAPAGSVVLSTRAPIGHVALAGIPMAINQGCRMLVPRDGVDSKFYVYLLIAEKTRLQSLGQGSTFVELGTRSLGDLQVADPPLPQQRAMVRFLDEETTRIDALIQKNRALMRHLASLFKSERSQMILGGTDSLGPDGLLRRDRLPSHWKAVGLRAVTTCLDGKRIPLNSEERFSRQGDVPYWGANGVVDQVDDWLFDEPLILLGEDGAPFDDPSRDVAFVVNEKVWVNNHIHVLRPEAVLNARYAAAALNCSALLPLVEGTTRLKLTQTKMGSIKIPLPPLSEQNEIVDRLKQLEAHRSGVIQTISQVVERLQRYRESLITAAVTGQIDVGEAA